MNDLFRVPLTFPDNPAVGDEFAASNGATYRWDGDVWVGIGGGAPPFDDSHLLHLTGGTVTGELLVTGPTTAPQSVVTRDWVETVTSGSLYQGGWRVSTNVPPLPADPRHGDRYLCLTANPAVPETPPGNIPGLTGRQINNGAYIIWDEPASLWQLIQFSLGGGLTTDTADLRYLRLIGGTTTGKILTPATVDADPATTVTTKGYVDSKVSSGADVTAWQTHTAGGLWTTRSNINLRLINGGANIQVRALLDPNTRPLTVAGSVAFILPGSHRPRWNGSTTCAGPRQTQTPDNLDTIGNVSWFAASGEVRANAIWNTNNWVPPPQWLLLDIVIPRT